MTGYRNRAKLAPLAALSLLFTLLSPLLSSQSAFADTTSFTVTVKDHNGNLLPNAVVGVGYSDPTDFK